MKRSRVGVVIPVYNGERYLTASLDSLLCQSIRDFNIYVYNDGSTDGTAEILEKYQDPRLHVIHQRNHGVSTTRQRALQEAKEDLIAFLDADDIARPDRLQLQRDFLDANPEAVLVGSWLELMDENGQSSGTREYPVEHPEIVRVLPLENCIAQPAVMFRRQAAITAGMFRAGTDGAEDYDLWLRMGRQGRLHNIPEPLTRYRIHSSQFKAKSTRLQLRRTIATRLRATRCYGYRTGALYWATLIAQGMLLAMPASWIHRLFRLKLWVSSRIRSRSLGRGGSGSVRSD